MNQPIVGLFAVVIVLFGTLVAFTSRWSVFEAESLRDNPNNRRSLLEEERIKRGVIRAAGGQLLAGNVALSGQRYRRRYPTGDLFAHAVGYSFTTIGRAGTERYRNDELTGRETDLVSVLDSILEEDKVGNDVDMTLAPRAQEIALRGLRAAGKGAAVALDVKTGAVRVMAVNPTYDPNDLDERGRLKAAAVFNRATQSGYAPGSTMKVVTAAAALDSGKLTPSSVVDGKSPKTISGVPLQNFGGESFGRIDLTTALTNSVNTVWAEVGVRLGRDTMGEYMERFGFYADPPLDFPDGELVPSGVRKNGRLVPPTSPRFDIGRVAIGQGDLEVTPLQMASVAQTVGNGGRRMRPYLTEKVVDPDGRTVFEHEPDEAAEVISEESARTLTTLMKNVVREGTGTAAALEGVEVAGKTGTAEVDLNRRLNNTWFIGFTDQVAVAVVLERRTGTGGTVAAPIAKQVLQALGE